MKNIKRVALLLALVSATVVMVSCDKKERKNKKQDVKVNVVEDEMVMVLPNKSDIHFDKALTALDKKEYKTAGEHLAMGTNELTKESKNKGTIFKTNLETSIKHLTDISKQLEKGEKVDIDALRNMMANAEINLAHEYLVTDNTYVLTEPEKVADCRLHKVMDHNLKSLEAGTSKLKGDAKKESEKLKAEGKKLKVDYEAWKKKAEEHIKKTEAHFKKHQPEFSYDTYWGVLPQ